MKGKFTLWYIIVKDTKPINQSLCNLYYHDRRKNVFYRYAAIYYQDKSKNYTIILTDGEYSGVITQPFSRVVPPFGTSSDILSLPCLSNCTGKLVCKPQSLYFASTTCIYQNQSNRVEANQT